MANRESGDYRRDRNRDEGFGGEFQGGAEERSGRGRESGGQSGRGYDESGRGMQFGREHEEFARGERSRSGTPGGYEEGRWQTGRGFSGESGGYGSPGYASPGYQSREWGYPGGWGYEQERFGERFGRGSEGVDRSPGFRGTQGFGQTSGYSGYSEGQFGTRDRTRGRYTGRGPKGYTRSDDRIKEDVNDRLEQHGEIDAWEISVMVQSGEVTLEGTVPDRLMKRLAEDVAEESPGVKQVHNRLRIQGNALTSEEAGRSSTGSIGASRTSSGSTPKSSTRT